MTSSSTEGVSADRATSGVGGGEGQGGVRRPARGRSTGSSPGVLTDAAEGRGPNWRSDLPSAGRIAVDVCLWTAQTLLGLFFAGSGFGKVLMIDDGLYAQAPNAVSWYAAVPQSLIVFIGVCEVLGGLGLILPAMSRVKTGLLPLAAAGLGLTMILATAFHLLRTELGLAAVTFGLAAVASVIAVWRWRVRPIERGPLTVSRAGWTMATLIAVLLLVFAPTWYVATNVQF